MNNLEYVTTTDKEEIEDCKYFYVCKEDGELIASVAFNEGKIIEKDGYVVVIDHNDDTAFETKDGKIYVELESEDYYEI